MAILLECGSCGRKFRAKDQHRGKRVKCPDCRKYIVIEGERVADHDVFISYSKHDKAVADAICAAMENERMRCWIAPRDIEGGQKWGAAIINGIEDARAMVVVYSAHSNRSEQVIREVERAVAMSVPILPFRIDDTPMCKEMQYYLGASHWLDALTGPLEDHIRRLVPAARGLLAGLDQSVEAHTAAPKPVAAGKGRRITRLGLLGGAAALVAIAVIVLSVVLSRGNKRGGSDIGGPEPAQTTGLSDVVPLKTQAELAWEKVKDLDPGQGFGPLLREGTALHRQAGTYYEQKAYAEAKASYGKLLDQCRVIGERQEQRTAALAQRTKAQGAESLAGTAGAPKSAKALWDAARAAAGKAQAGFARAAFAEAARDWQAATGQYEKAQAEAEGVKRVAAARASYGKALTKYDAARLAKYGGDAWQRVQQQLRAAAGDHAKVEAAYRRAQDVLPQADRSARGAYVADLLSRAKAAERTNPDQALGYIEELLKEDPKHTAALALKAKVGIYVPRWWLDKAESTLARLKDVTDRAKWTPRVAIVAAMARSGDYTRAKKTAAAIGGEGIVDMITRSSAYRDIAEAQAKAGRFEEARKTAASIEYNLEKAWAFSEIAKAYAVGGDLARAEATAATISGFGHAKYAKIGAYVAVALQQAKSENKAAARKTLEKTMKIAAACDLYMRVGLYRPIVKAQMELGDQAAARKCIALAKAAVAAMDKENVPTLDQVEVVGMLAMVGEITEAKRIALGLNEKVGALDDAYSYIARAQAQAGDIAGALATCKLIKNFPSSAYYAVVEAQVKTNRLKAAKETAELISTPWWEEKGSALRLIARAEAKTGDLRKISEWIEAQSGVCVVYACCGVAEGLTEKRKEAQGRK